MEPWSNLEYLNSRGFDLLTYQVNMKKKGILFISKIPGGVI
jgi:hypothetical protein